MVASRKGFKDIVELLLKDSRIDPTADDNEALRSAIRNGHKDIVDLLLADPRVATKWKPINLC
jgi:hypothetical protein